MTDIVERLRREGVEFHEQLEAADEIERLTAQVAEWRERYEAEHRDHEATIKHADRLEDECAKLSRYDE